MKRTLAGPLVLHGVDVEPLCLGVLEEMIRRSAMREHLQHADREEALAFLLAECWVLSRKFDPARRVPFRLYAYGTLRHRLVDFWRKWYGSAGQKRPLGPDARCDRDRLEPSEPESTGDAASLGGVGLRWALGERDAAALAANEEVRRQAARSEGYYELLTELRREILEQVAA